MRLHSIVQVLLALACAPFDAHAKNVSLADGNVDAAELLGPWFNYEQCYFTDETYNTSALLEQPSEIVPNGTIFLMYAECGSVERTGTVPVGTKLVVIPLIDLAAYDIDDDINSSLTNVCPGRGTTLFEEFVDEYQSQVTNLTLYSKKNHLPL
jgi:hypothetical protein